MTIELGHLAELAVAGMIGVIAFFAKGTLKDIKTSVENVAADIKESVARLNVNDIEHVRHEEKVSGLERRVSRLEERVEDLTGFLRDQGFRIREDIRKARGGGDAG